MAITGIYTKDFPDLGRDAGATDLIPIAEVGNIVTKKTPVSGLITSARVVGALGFTPYNASNPAGYISGITSGMVTTALGFTPYNATNPAGYTSNLGTVTSVSGTGTVSGLTLSGTVTTSGSLTLGGTLSLTSGQVTTALGFTPYNATNPAGYITSAALSGYLPLSGGTIASSGSANTLNINHTSGSGIALNILKNGNGEALTIVKGSGSGNAASITGGITLLSELNLTTKLADVHINSAATWNAKIGGSGTTNYLAKFTASGVVGNSAVFESGGNVGIGTTSPLVKLHVKGTSGWGELRLEGQSFSGGNGGVVEFYSEGTALADISSDTTKNLIFRTNGITERMQITSGGNVLIGTTTDAGYKLDVNGSSIIRGVATFGNSINIIDNNVLNLGSNQGGGATLKYNSNGNLDITPRAGFNTIFTGGNVGINTTSPSQKLDVNGLINSTNGISVGGSGVSVVWTGTQAQYDAITTKSSTTIYFIQ